MEMKDTGKTARLPPTIDSELLRTFVTIVDCGSFSGAAQRLFRGQSAVSLQMKRLEDRLGVQLLERDRRRVIPTLQGERILERARKIIALNDALVADACEPALRGVVRIGAPEDFATSHLPQVLAQFTHAYPQVALEVTCELTMSVLDRFARGELDIALVKREASNKVPGRRVWREPLVWVGTALPDERGRPIDLVVSPAPCVYRKRATQALDAHGRPWHVSYTCGALAGSLAAVRAGLGITVLPREMVPKDLPILQPKNSDLPRLADTEIALLEAPGIDPPARRLIDLVVQSLEAEAQGKVM